MVKRILAALWSLIDTAVDWALFLILMPIVFYWSIVRLVRSK